MDHVLQSIADDWALIQKTRDRMSRNLAKARKAGEPLRHMALVTGVPRTTARRLSEPFLVDTPVP